MIDGDEGKLLGEGESFGVGNTNQERASQSGTVGDGDGVKVGEGDVGLRQGGANDGDDGAEMLAGSELGDYSAITGVGGYLGGYYGRQGAGAALDDSRSGLVAGGFDG
jgi:hypothetical protein